jgi:hypothetical protein
VADRRRDVVDRRPLERLPMKILPRGQQRERSDDEDVSGETSHETSKTLDDTQASARARSARVTHPGVLRLRRRASTHTGERGRVPR